MFLHVRTKREHFVFEQLWGDFCEERDLMFVERNLNPSRYLLIGEGERYIGTVECAPYQKPEESNAEFFYPFSQNRLITELNKKRVFEIGKLSISKHFRGMGHFKRLAVILFIHALEQKVDWYIAVVTKRMYMYLRSLGFQMEPIDEPFLFHETLVGVPIRLHAWQGMKYLYSLKEFRDVIYATPQAQQLIQENERKITLTH